jgi:4-amino-4-deoxy-L-arabinose transferase-like glycosyltransferase
VIANHRWRRLAPWAPVGLLLLAFALRTYALGVRELPFDEIASVFIAVRGPLHLLTYLRDAIREHPPFYYLLLSLWMVPAGQSEFAVRFLSVIIGLTTVAAMYRLVRKTTRLPAALLATFLLVISPFHIAASQNARMYGLLALFSLLSIFFFVRLLGQDRARWWGLFWLVTGLGMFTHYYMAFVLLAEDLFLLLNWRRYRRLWPRWLAIHLALVGMVALWAALSPGLWATLISFWRRGAASHVRWEDFFRALNGLYLGATLPPNWLHLALPRAAAWTPARRIAAGIAARRATDRRPGPARARHRPLLDGSAAGLYPGNGPGAQLAG